MFKSHGSWENIIDVRAMRVGQLGQSCTYIVSYPQELNKHLVSSAFHYWTKCLSVVTTSVIKVLGV